MADRTCTVDGCERRRETREWCDKHYRRWLKHGDPTHCEIVRGDDRKRFDAKVDRSGECWLWTAGLSHDGYPVFSLGSRPRYAHRTSYEWHVGPIPDGLDLDHLCHSIDASCPGGSTCVHRRCVNPEHLEPVTRRANLLRGRTLPAKNVAKQACVNGHDYVPENTRLNARGGRECRACDREKHQRARDERSTP